MEFDSIVVGAGFSGAVVARQLAEAGRRVLVCEQRAQIGGNMYDALDENGVSVHWYGPHIFHTGSKEVVDYLGKFTDWVPYEHRVLGRIDGELVPIPFNFTSLEALFPPEKAAAIEARLAELFPGQRTASVMALQQSEDALVREFGAFVLEKVFLHYTAKQWGTPIEQVDRAVIDRVPVVLGYDDRYFQDQYQMMPARGFTPLFERLLDHPAITVRLNVAATHFDEETFGGDVIFTGALDALFDYRFGELPYRSLRLDFERLAVTQFQPAAVVNYPNEEKFTRITEFKQLAGQEIADATTILREYPLAYDPRGTVGNVPYYVIESPENRALYERYAALAATFPRLKLCGRLAEYRYYNMDAAVLRALALSQEILEQ